MMQRRSFRWLTHGMSLALLALGCVLLGVGRGHVNDLSWLTRRAPWHTEQPATPAALDACTEAAGALLAAQGRRDGLIAWAEGIERTIAQSPNLSASALRQARADARTYRQQAAAYAAQIPALEGRRRQVCGPP